jgi:hypothetical protein
MGRKPLRKQRQEITSIEMRQTKGRKSIRRKKGKPKIEEFREEKKRIEKYRR